MILESLLEKLAQCQHNVQIEQAKRRALYDQWHAQNCITEAAQQAEYTAMDELTQAAIKHRKHGLKAHPAIHVTCERQDWVYDVHLTECFEDYRPTEEDNDTQDV